MNRREFLWSVALLIGLVVFALIGLVLQANWPKLLRVAAAAAAYLLVLLPAALKRLPPSGDAALAYRLFAIAGAAAGLVSGLARPSTTVPIVVVQAVASALLLGGIHWLALHHYRRLMPASPTR